MSRKIEDARAYEAAGLLISPDQTNPSLSFIAHGDFKFHSGVSSHVKNEFDDADQVPKATLRLFELLIELIRESNLDFDAIFGIPRGGLRFSQAASFELRIPHLEPDPNSPYLLEKHFYRGTSLRRISRILMVDDATTIGSTASSYAQRLAWAYGIEVVGLASITSYDFIRRIPEEQRRVKFPVLSVTDFPTTLKHPAYINKFPEERPRDVKWYQHMLEKVKSGSYR